MSLAWLITGALVMGRITGVIAIMPVFGAQGIPRLVKALLSVALASVIAPSLPVVEMPPTISILVLAMIGEIILGVLVGGVVRLAFGALGMAGEMISTQIGHGAAMFFDPVSGSAQGPVGTLGVYLASLIFIGTNLHLRLLISMTESFDVIPPGGSADLISAGAVWLDYGTVVIDTGMALCGPIIALVFLSNLSVAVVTRLAPQMNVFFALGLIFTVGGGEALFFLGLPEMLTAHLELIDSSLDRIPLIIDRIVIRGVGDE